MTMIVHMDGGVGDYLTELRVAGRSANTLKVRRYELLAWRRWLAAEGVHIEAATRADMIRFLSTRRAPQTRSSYRSSIRGFTEWQVTTGRRPDDPSATLPAVTVPRCRPHPLPDAVYRAAYARASARQRDMLALGRWAGMRAAEIARAHGDDLMGDRGSESVRIIGKGDKERIVPAHPEVVRVLREHSGRAVFPSPIRLDQPIAASQVVRTLSRLLPDDWTAHSLRHAFGTEAYARTRDLLLVARWMGHESIETTRGYVAVNDADFAAIRTLHLVA